eukprot:747164-Hanusia_phi.AAC.2
MKRRLHAHRTRCDYSSDKRSPELFSAGPARLQDKRHQRRQERVYSDLGRQLIGLAPGEATFAAHPVAKGIFTLYIEILKHLFRKYFFKLEIFINPHSHRMNY